MDTTTANEWEYRVMKDSTVNNNLQPAGWELGNIAISKTHFYMIYTDAKEGISVHWHNKITGASDRRHNFETRRDAQSWIKDTHYKNTAEKYSLQAGSCDVEVNQRWAHKGKPEIIIEIVCINEQDIYTAVYSEAVQQDGIVTTNDAFVLRHFLENDYCLMQDGETIEQCLARVGAEHKETI